MPEIEENEAPVDVLANQIEAQWVKTCELLDLPVERVTEMRKGKKYRELFDLIHSTRNAKLDEADELIRVSDTNPFTNKSIASFADDIREFNKGEDYPDIVKQTPAVLDQFANLVKYNRRYADIQGASADQYFFMLGDLIENFEKVQEAQKDALRSARLSGKNNNEKLLSIIEETQLGMINLKKVIAKELGKEIPEDVTPPKEEPKLVEEPKKKQESPNDYVELPPNALLKKP